MKFSLNNSLEILANTPVVVSTLLENLSDEQITTNEGENTWNVKEVVAHLIVCEEINWIPRIRLILNHPEPVLAPMNMEAHFEIAENNSLKKLLLQFKKLRINGLAELEKYQLHETDFRKTAIHPVIGEVNLSQLISTWTAHDLTHLTQIARILAKQNRDLVGNFKQFLNILN